MPGTNAVYTFKAAGPKQGDLHVYDNCDAYPKGAAQKLTEAGLGAADRTLDCVAKALAIGDIPDSLEMRVSARDWRHTCATNFRYEISEVAGAVRITGYSPDLTDAPPDFRLKPGQNFPKWREIFSGGMGEFIAWAEKRDSLGG